LVDTAEKSAVRAASTPAALSPAPTVPESPPVGAKLGRLIRTVAWRSAAVLIFLAIWQFAPTLGWADRTFLTPFSEVIRALWELAVSGELWEDVSISLIRSLSGFFIAISVGVPLGLLIAWYRGVANFLNPLLTIFLNTAAVALLPVFVLILGIDETSKIAIIAYACVWPVLYNTISGARNVDPLLIKSVQSLGVKGPKLFQKVILPAALPTIFTGIRLAGAASILILITTELVGAKAGLGYLISSSQYNFQIPQMYAGIVTVAAIGVGFNALLVYLERRVSHGR